ncbi:hypothetical protein BH10ACI1_BH10ACI1_32850 [soil metagenome]
MSIEKRQFIRFSLDIPAIRFTRYGEAVETVLHQISIGGGLVEWDESILVGDEFRVLIQLPNGNFLPLMCRALYRFTNNGIGTRFIEITQFQQELISQVISQSLTDQGLPLQIDVFGLPPTYMALKKPQISDNRQQADDILEDILN